MKALLTPLRVEMPTKSNEPEIFASKVKKPGSSGFGELLDLVGKVQSQATTADRNLSGDRNSRGEGFAQKEDLANRNGSGSEASRSEGRFEERERSSTTRESSERKNVKKKEADSAERSEGNEEAGSEVNLKDDAFETQVLNTVAVLTETVSQVEGQAEQLADELTLGEISEWVEGESFAPGSDEFEEFIPSTVNSNSEIDSLQDDVELEMGSIEDPRFQDPSKLSQENSSLLAASQVEQQIKAQSLSVNESGKLEDSDATFENREAPSLLETWTQDQEEGLSQDVELPVNQRVPTELADEAQAPTPAVNKVETQEAQAPTKSGGDRSVDPLTQTLEVSKEDKTLSELSKNLRASRPHSENIHLNAKGEALGKELGRVILQRLRGGEKHFRIFLTPPRLGQVQVDMDLQDGRLNLDMKVDSPAVRHLMNARVAELQESLATHGVQMEGFQVDVSDWGDQGPASPFSEFGDSSRQGRSSSRSQAEGANSELDDEVLEETISYHDGLIDTRA